MKRLLLAGAAALLLTGVIVNPTDAAMQAGVGGGFSAGGAPRAAITGGFNRGAVSGFNRAGTFGGTNRGPAAYASVNRGPTTFTRTPNGAGGTVARGHWGWWHGRRHFFPGVAAGVGLGLAFGGWGYPYDYGNDCVAWDGWRWVNVCYPYY